MRENWIEWKKIELNKRKSIIFHSILFSLIQFYFLRLNSIFLDSILFSFIQGKYYWIKVNRRKLKEDRIKSRNYESNLIFDEPILFYREWKITYFCETHSLFCQQMAVCETKLRSSKWNCFDQKQNESILRITFWL